MSDQVSASNGAPGHTLSGPGPEPPGSSPLSLEDLLLNRKRLRRQLLTRPGLKPIRIAVLGGTTTSELVDFLEIFLLNDGFKPDFHQSEYGRYFEDAVLEPELVSAFKPDIVYLHTCSANLKHQPPASCNEHEFRSYVDAELDRFRSIWAALAALPGCQIIQNNFEFPASTTLGNLDSISPAGRTRFINELNREFAAEAARNPRLILQDLCAIAAAVGTRQWFDPARWFSYKLANSVEGTWEIASSLSALVRAMYGRSRKVLVLDLDNTLWGGIIGDDGVNQIVIGRETALGEAYTAFQEYCLSLRERGILLAVCSKNDEQIARQGFGHPDSVLKLEHFSAFKANWEPKHENLRAIADELSLGVDSFVFIDDNPAERAIVAAQIPGIAVPDIGSDVTKFISVIQDGRYFEVTSIGAEDLDRARLYEENAARATLAPKFANYGEFLDYLEMTAEIAEFDAVHMERIAQLTNKSNQFNLTTRRFTRAELDAIAADPGYIGLYGRLSDRFGDNGLISVVLGRIEQRTLHMDLWLMSCRVLKRDMEFAMLDSLVERARSRSVDTIIGYYLPTAKNAMVAEHYQRIGFTLLERDEQSGSSTWTLDLSTYEPRNRHIKLSEMEIRS